MTSSVGSSRSKLSEQISDEIRRGGPMPLTRFMELALYHPQLGYYSGDRQPFGARGDFFTNSQLQPVFGRLIAQQIARWRAEMGNPPDFTVVEMGAGRGETAEQVRRSLPDVRCLTVEAFSGKLPPRLTGVVFSNEFFDALPVHLVEHRKTGLVEYRVGVGPRGFEWVEEAPSDPRLAEYVARYAPGLGEGQKIEVHLAALEQLERIAQALERGYLLTIDYGYSAVEIAGGRRLPRGSLMSYEKHQAREDVLGDPGRRDITAHVNFTALEQRGGQFGLAPLGLRTQAQFLLEIGEQDNFEAALQAEGETAQLPLRMQLKTLLFGLGETFRVLVQSKGPPG